MTTSFLPWLAPQIAARVLLLINHIVASEPQACQRLQAHVGKTIDIGWRTRAPAGGGLLAKLTPPLPTPLRWRITPAGLFEARVATGDASTGEERGGLSVTVTLESPLQWVQRAITGQRPEVQIEGDAALAEVAAWMVRNLRWDIEDDVARLLGTSPTAWLRALASAIGEALSRLRPGSRSPR